MNTVGAYRITSRLGRGGMSTVYKGVQVSLDRPVAIKVISRELAGDEELIDRFRRESLIIARLSHPNIIHVIDRGLTRDRRPYFVMEFVEGTDLSRVIREGLLDPNRKLDVMIQVCKALGYAHKNGVVHRDIKPANILLDRDGNARVLDFGIAQFADETGPRPDRTGAGLFMGTLAYMSPEQQVDARAVTAASDIYSLGAVMYELFTGRKPVGRLERPSAVAPGLPPALDDVILRCLEPDPARRPPSADEVRDRLLQILRGAHIGGDQRRRAGQGLASAGEKFALLDVLKEDGFGAAYLYEDRVEHKLLVIKKKPVGSPGYTEARLLTTLKHPGIVNVLGATRNEQVYIVVMEYLSGGSLRERLVRPFPWDEVVRVGRGVLSALAFAHRNRIVHGDLRPTNVLFTDRDEVKLADFGQAEHYGDPGGPPNWYGIRGEPRSRRADLFAAGAILHQMLTGVLPRWEGCRLVPHEAAGSAPAGLWEVLRDLLQLNPEARPPSAEAVLEDLDRLAVPGPWGATGTEEPTVVLGAGRPAGTRTPDEGPPSGARGTWMRRVLFAAGLVAAAVAGYLVRLEDAGRYGRALRGAVEGAVVWVRGLLGAG